MIAKPKNLIMAKNISKIFHGKKIIDDVSLTIKEGEIITVIGPNGGGKSTLAKILVGITKADSGKITRDKNLRIGYMPQKIKVNTSIPITVSEFLCLQINYQVEESELNELAKQLGIAKLMHASMHEISGGETQRVMLARALLPKPRLLILDEPEQNVDISGQAEIYTILHNLNKQLKLAILLVSHDLHLVMKSSNHVICLNHHICCEGVPEKLSKEKAYLDLFSKEVVSNLAIYPHHHTHKHDICEH